MLARDQIKLIAQEIHRTADVRMHQCDDEYDRQRLWEVVRHASHAIEAVTEMERDGTSANDRERRARQLVTELESALEAARQARVVMTWIARRGQTVRDGHASDGHASDGHADGARASDGRHGRDGRGEQPGSRRGYEA